MGRMNYQTVKSLSEATPVFNGTCLVTYLISSGVNM